MRGLKNITSARLITEGWLLHYNYIRPHESLNGKTPAHVAGIKYPYRNWQDIVAKRDIITPAQVSATSTLKIPELPEQRKRIVVSKRPSRLSRHRDKPMPMLICSSLDLV